LFKKKKKYSQIEFDFSPLLFVLTISFRNNKCMEDLSLVK